MPKMSSDTDKHEVQRFPLKLSIENHDLKYETTCLLFNHS